MLTLRFEAVNAVGGHVFVRIFNGDTTHVCGTLFLSMPEWLTLTNVLTAAISPTFAFSHILHLHACDVCRDELSSVECPICGADLCTSCWGDHPHAHGVHIEGSTK
jgi:hypothetical protein